MPDEDNETPQQPAKPDADPAGEAAFNEFRDTVYNTIDSETPINLKVRELRRLFDEFGETHQGLAWSGTDVFYIDAGGKLHQFQIDAGLTSMMANHGSAYDGGHLLQAIYDMFPDETGRGSTSSATPVQPQPPVKTQLPAEGGASEAGGPSDSVIGFADEPLMVDLPSSGVEQDTQKYTEPEGALTYNDVRSRVDGILSDANLNYDDKIAGLRDVVKDIRQAGGDVMDVDGDVGFYLTSEADGFNLGVGGVNSPLWQQIKPLDIVLDGEFTESSGGTYINSREAGTGSRELFDDVRTDVSGILDDALFDDVRIDVSGILDDARTKRFTFDDMSSDVGRILGDASQSDSEKGKELWKVRQAVDAAGGGIQATPGTHDDFFFYLTSPEGGELSLKIGPWYGPLYTQMYLAANEDIRGRVSEILANGSLGQAEKVAALREVVTDIYRLGGVVQDMNGQVEFCFDPYLPEGAFPDLGVGDWNGELWQLVDEGSWATSLYQNSGWPEAFGEVGASDPKADLAAEGGASEAGGPSDSVIGFADEPLMVDLPSSGAAQDTQKYTEPEGALTYNDVRSRVDRIMAPGEKRLVGLGQLVVDIWEAGGQVYGLNGEAVFKLEEGGEPHLLGISYRELDSHLDLRQMQESYIFDKALEELYPDPPESAGANPVIFNDQPYVLVDPQSLLESSDALTVRVFSEPPASVLIPAGRQAESRRDTFVLPFIGNQVSKKKAAAGTAASMAAIGVFIVATWANGGDGKAPAQPASQQSQSGAAVVQQAAAPTVTNTVAPPTVTVAPEQVQVVAEEPEQQQQQQEPATDQQPVQEAPAVEEAAPPEEPAPAQPAQVTLLSTTGSFTNTQESATGDACAPQVIERNGTSSTATGGFTFKLRQDGLYEVSSESGLVGIYYPDGRSLEVSANDTPPTGWASQTRETGMTVDAAGLFGDGTSKLVLKTPDGRVCEVLYKVMVNWSQALPVTAN